jgi:hypothetical protein
VRVIERAHEPQFSPDGDRVVVLRGEGPDESAVAVTTATGVEVSFALLSRETADVAGTLARVLRGERTVRVTRDGLQHVFWSADGKRPILAVADGIDAVSDDGRWVVARGDGDERVVRVGGVARAIPNSESQFPQRAVFGRGGAILYIPIDTGSWCTLDLASWAIHQIGTPWKPSPATAMDDDLWIPSFQALPAETILATNLTPYGARLMGARTGETLLEDESHPVDWGTQAFALDDRSALIAAKPVSSPWQVRRIDVVARRVMWTHDTDDEMAEPPALQLAPDSRTAAVFWGDRFEVLDVKDGTRIFDSAQMPPLGPGRSLRSPDPTDDR